MIIQKSNQDEKPTLYLVPTPIGNFQDMTYRAVEVLNSVDYIFAEDTRVTKVLLSHFQINTKLYSYHAFNESEKSSDIINLLKAGSNIAVVSDAGLPGISDPGFLVAKRAVEAGFNVVCLPGANAGLTALVASGLPCDKFFFYGFLKHKESQKEKELKALVDYKETIIFYESPLRAKETLNLMYQVFGDRNVVLARELTKKYEEYIRGTLKELSKLEGELKGEIVIIVEGAKALQEEIMLNELSVEEHYNYYLSEGIDSKEALKLVAKVRNIPKSDIYKLIKTKK